MITFYFVPDLCQKWRQCGFLIENIQTSAYTRHFPTLHSPPVHHKCLFRLWLLLLIFSLCFLIPHQEKEGEFHCRRYSDWRSSSVRPSCVLPAGPQGQTLASPLCSATVPQLAGEGRYQRGRGARWWQEGWVWNSEEDGQGEALAVDSQHWRAPQSCRRHSSPNAQLGGFGGRCWSHQLLCWQKSWIEMNL